MQAMHGGKATNETIDSQKSAVLLRGGLRPQAYGSPAAMRVTRARWRRRRPLRRTRAALLAQGQPTNRPYHGPELGTKIASQAKRHGGAERFSAPAVQQSIAVDLALLDDDDPLLSALALSIVQTARQPEAHPLSRLQTVPGVGKMFSLVLL
jgi:hypothetical protein